MHRSTAPQGGDRTAFHGAEWGSGRRASRKISIACGASNKGRAGVTKSQLGLPPVTRRFVAVPMGQAQFALYGALKDDAIRDILAIRGAGAADLIRAKRSIMRLMQASTNPVAIVEAMLADARTLNRDRVAALYHAVLQEGVSQKVLFAADRARELIGQNRKVVIWTIFQSTIESMVDVASDLSPVFINGTVESGSADDPTTREGKIRLFHENPDCGLLVANPAACSEGISLHTVCHEAIYLDRGYNAAHYLQSIDRIHRLGLAPTIETNISILQSITPTGLASIDYSVARALLRKLRVMEAALEDEDIRQISLDEEENVNNQVFDDSRDLEDMNELLDLLVQKPTATQIDEADMA